MSQPQRSVVSRARHLVVTFAIGTVGFLALRVLTGFSGIATKRTAALTDALRRADDLRLIGLQCRQQGLNVGRQRGFEAHGLSGAGVLEAEFGGVQ